MKKVAIVGVEGSGKTVMLAGLGDLYTYPDEEGYFSLCVMDKSFKKQMAYLGSVSGRDEDKIGKAGLTPVYADNTVYFEEAKLVLVCKKLYQSELQESGFLYQDTIDANYPQRDFHTMYVGKIEKVLVRDDEYCEMIDQIIECYD